MGKRSLVLLALVFFSLQASAEIVVKLSSRGDANAKYAIEMLELALQKSGADYRLAVEPVQEGNTWSIARLKSEIADGAIDVAWAATDLDMEAALLPIRVPLYKGLLGYRVLLVHPDNLLLFAKVEKLSDMHQFVLGQGTGWPDVDILKANGLQVEEVSKFENLFYMVDGKRFDAFPRGVNEPWAEIASRPDLKLVIEPNLLLVYKMPYYLFVSKAKPELAALIEQGFDKAIADGSFDKIFFSNEMIKTVVEKANIPGRKTFILTNPDLPKATPLDDDRLWYDPNKSPGLAKE